MTEHLPDPLVPAGVDLRDFSYMPLDVVRLRDSGLAAKATGDQFRAAVLLWCASWHQVPAASLPDDDEELANLCGYGRAPKEWRKVRLGALRGWVMCSDGRMYHPTVAAKARESWVAKLKQRWMTECGRVKKHNQRHGTSLVVPEFDEWVSLGCPPGQQATVPRDTPPTSPNCPGEIDSKGRERERERELRKDKQPSVASAFPAEKAPAMAGLSLVGPPDPPPPKGPPDCPHLAVLALWAEVLPALPQHNPALWRGARATHLRARWRETAAEKGWRTEAEGLAYLRKLFAYVGQSRFLSGRAQAANGRPAFAVELAWLVKPENWAKTIEGKYHVEAA